MKIKFWNRKKPKTLTASDLIEAYKTGATHLAMSMDSIECRQLMKTYFKERFNIDVK